MASRWLPLSGVVFVVLMLVVIVGSSGETPATNDSAAEIASFYDDESVRQGIAAFLLAATVPFLLLFATILAGLSTGTDERRGRSGGACCWAAASFSERSSWSWH